MALLRLWGTHGIRVDSFPQVGELLYLEMEAALRIPGEALLIHSALCHLHSNTGGTAQSSFRVCFTFFFLIYFIFWLLWVFIAEQAFL